MSVNHPLICSWNQPGEPVLGNESIVFCSRKQ